MSLNRSLFYELKISKNYEFLKNCQKLLLNRSFVIYKIFSNVIKSGILLSKQEKGHYIEFHFLKANEWKTRLSPNANLVAGGFGGLCSLVVGYPFDTVKVRMQTSTCYKNAFECFRKIVIHEGALSLFRQENLTYKF